MVGNKYVATTPDGDMGIEFKAGNKATLTMTGEDPIDGTYSIVGDEIILSSEEGMPLHLKHADKGAARGRDGRNQHSV